jgi:hypothetical protein
VPVDGGMPPSLGVPTFSPGLGTRSTVSCDGRRKRRPDLRQPRARTRSDLAPRIVERTLVSTAAVGRAPIPASWIRHRLRADTAAGVTGTARRAIVVARIAWIINLGPFLARIPGQEDGTGVPAKRAQPAAAVAFIGLTVVAVLGIAVGIAEACIDASVGVLPHKGNRCVPASCNGRFHSATPRVVGLPSVEDRGSNRRYEFCRSVLRRVLHARPRNVRGCFVRVECADCGDDGTW